MMMLSYRNDDDEKKRKGSALLERALSDMLFVFDPNNLKFTISRPMPALATLGKFIDAGQHLFAIDADDYDKHGNPKIIKDIIDLTPGGKRVSQIADFVTED